MSSQSWTLSPELRLRVASRAGANLCRLAFEAKKEVTDADGKQIAERLERDAYAAAQAQASTTTGTRPTQETTKIYTRYKPLRRSKRSASHRAQETGRAPGGVCQEGLQRDN